MRSEASATATLMVTYSPTVTGTRHSKGTVRPSIVGSYLGCMRTPPSRRMVSAFM